MVDRKKIPKTKKTDHDSLKDFDGKKKDRRVISAGADGQLIAGQLRRRTAIGDRHLFTTVLNGTTNLSRWRERARA